MLFEGGKIIGNSFTLFFLCSLPLNWTLDLSVLFLILFHFRFFLVLLCVEFRQKFQVSQSGAAAV